MANRKDKTQTTSAAKAGFSERSARRLESGQRQLGPIKARGYRTRIDPLEPIWNSVVLPLLEHSASITPVGLFDHLCEEHSDKFLPNHRRTLERRVRQWRLLHGDDQDVIFRQEKEFGRQGIMDFTWADFTVTIQGEKLEHRLFNYRLPASGWSHAQVVYGGESFTAVATGLKGAFERSEGVPLEVRTDSLSAAYKNNTSEREFTESFQQLATHYGFQPTRNNTGIAHENGAIESSNNHLKNQIRQALAIRGSHDFETKNEYELFVDQLVERRNRRTKPLLVDEQRQLQPLPKYDCVNYTVHVLKVSTTSTVQLKRVTYSVPSRLIGGTVRVHLYDKTLEVYCHDEHTLTLDRVHTRSCHRGHQIDYRHIIGSLMKKPRAFRGCQWRDEMLPSEDYRQIWQYVDAQLTMDEASFYMVKLLNVANKSEREEAVGRFVLDGIRVGRLPTLFDCEDRFLQDEIWTDSPKVEQHTLSSYQQILEGVK